MIGVRFEVIDKLIKKNNINSDMLQKNIQTIIDCNSVITQSCNGDTIYFVYQEINNQEPNLKKICKIVENYSEVLKDVQIAYKTQDENIKHILNHTNSQI